MIRIKAIETGNFKLDGGAMFGVVPRRMWEKLNPPDAENMCTWAMRCLYVESENSKILFDTGIGTKLSDKMKSHFYPHGADSLMSSLEQINVSPEEITDVFLTHLHFDHCGGAVTLNTNNELVPTFKNAKYWSNKRHFDWAMNPNPREKASFLKENIEPLQKHGVLHFVEETQDIHWKDQIYIKFAFGHTEAMMLPYFVHNEKTFMYMADLLPSAGHISMPFVMSYDIRPLQTLKEKKEILDWIVEDKVYCILEHDKDSECITMMRNEKNRIVLDSSHKLYELMQ